METKKIEARGAKGMNRTNDKLARYIDRLCADDGSLTKWAKTFDADPLEAFARAERAVKAAAKREVGYKLRAVLEYHGPDAVRKMIRLRTAPKRSTDAMTNYVDSVVTTIWDDLYADCR